MESLLLTLISFGDSAIAVGVLLSGTAFLIVTRSYKAAAILFLAVVAAGGVIGTLKTLFIGCDLYLSDLDIRFPSGHAALSSAGLGTVCVLLVSRMVGWRRAAVIALFAAAEAVIVTTLVAMGFHTFYEVIVGLLVGGGAVAGAYWATRATAAEPIKIKGFLASIATVVVAIHVAQVPSRDLASILAMVMHEQTSICRPSERVAAWNFPDRWSQQAAAGLTDEAALTVDADYSYATGVAPPVESDN